MKHAGSQSLASLDPLLSEIRQLPGLIEKKTGIFYLKGHAFLHFHEDPQGLFADAKLDAQTFTRYPVNAPQEQLAFLKALRQSVIPKAASVSKTSQP